MMHFLLRNIQRGTRHSSPCLKSRGILARHGDVANPNGPAAGTAFFGGPVPTGAFDGLQAEYARVPFATVGLVKIPDNVSDDQAILLSDIFPTAYFGAALAEIEEGDTVAVFGCGPVGLFAILSAQLMGAGRIFAVDAIPSRLELAAKLGAEAINYDKEDPVSTIKRLTGKIGVDRVIDAVGVDANRPHGGLIQQAKSLLQSKTFSQEKQQVEPEKNPQGDNFHPGDAPSQALLWEAEVVAKGGTIAIIGVYPETVQVFPLGVAMNKNVTLTMGHCPHRKYIPELMSLVSTGMVNPTQILTQHASLTSALDAYKAFDEREDGWVKVELVPATMA